MISLISANYLTNRSHYSIDRIRRILLVLKRSPGLIQSFKDSLGDISLVRCSILIFVRMNFLNFTPHNLSYQHGLSIIQLHLLRIQNLAHRDGFEISSLPHHLVHLRITPTQLPHRGEESADVLLLASFLRRPLVQPLLVPRFGLLSLLLPDLLLRLLLLLHQQRLDLLFAQFPLSRLHRCDHRLALSFVRRARQLATINTTTNRHLASASSAMSSGETYWKLLVISSPPLLHGSLFDHRRGSRHRDGTLGFRAMSGSLRRCL